MFRSKMSRGGSRRDFTAKGMRSHRKNFARPMRGGIRL